MNECRIMISTDVLTLRKDINIIHINNLLGMNILKIRKKKERSPYELVNISEIWPLLSDNFDNSNKVKEIMSSMSDFQYFCLDGLNFAFLIDNVYENKGRLVARGYGDFFAHIGYNVDIRPDIEFLCELFSWLFYEDFEINYVDSCNSAEETALVKSKIRKDDYNERNI